MGVMTRSLFPFAIGRNCPHVVNLIFKESTPRLDGSFNLKETVSPYSARVTDLTADEYQRLQSGGVTLHKGSSVAIPFEVPSAPDSILWQGVTYKVVSSTIAESASVFIIDQSPLGFSRVEPRA